MTIKDFENIIYNKCLSDFNIETEVFTIANTFFYCCNVPDDKIEDVKKLVLSYNVLKNCREENKFISKYSTLIFDNFKS